MLSVYTRHHPDCKNAGDKTWRRCNCPKWIWGYVNGNFIRRSARTPLWEEAEELRLRLLQAVTLLVLPAPQATEPTAPTTPLTLPVPAVQPHSPGEVLPPASKRPRVPIKKAVEAYLEDAVSRNVAEATLDKLETIFDKQFLTWTQTQGFEYIDEIDLDALLNFRSKWKDGALAKQKKQSRVIGFFWACVRRHYLIENPALGPGRIKVVQIPTDYFPPDEFQRILDATYVYGDPRGGYIPIEDARTRLRTLTLLMRWSGLRIRNAILLERHRLHGDSLLLYQAKTGTPVYVPLPSYVVKALETLPPGPKPNARYFFWSGNGKPKSAVADWQRAYRRLFELVDIRRPDGQLKRCHPHMFRATRETTSGWRLKIGSSRGSKQHISNAMIILSLCMTRRASRSRKKSVFESAHNKESFSRRGGTAIWNSNPVGTNSPVRMWCASRRQMLSCGRVDSNPPCSIRRIFLARSARRTVQSKK